MKQKGKKFCDILDKLGDQIIEIVKFYNEAKTTAEVVLELNYEDTCYHTYVTINDDLTATVNQERKDNLTEKDFPPDPYYPLGIDGIPESRIWDLSKYEVSLQLATIILPTFEDYLAKIKDGFETLQKLKLDNSASTEALGMLKNLHDVGVLFVTKFKKYEDSQQFVDDLKIYFPDYCDLKMVCGRFEELQVRMGIEPVEQNNRKGAVKNNPKPPPKGFSFGEGQAFFNGKDLQLSAGATVDIFKKLVDSQGSTVKHTELDSQSTDSNASDFLRGKIKTIKTVLKKNKLPYKIRTIRGTGYVLEKT